MEVIVGLLIVIGTILEGSEGIKCYVSEGADAKNATDCELVDGNGYNACVRLEEGRKVVGRKCGYATKDCLPRSSCLSAWDKRCEDDYEDDATTQSSPSNTTTSSQGRASKKRRQEVRQACYCFTDLCNPAGRSTPNVQVLLSILVAASLYAFNNGLGEL